MTWLKALISFSDIGLRRLLVSLAVYCEREKMKINYIETKVWYLAEIECQA